VGQLFTRACTNQITNWLVRSCITLGACTSHEHIWTHNIHHGLDLGEAIIFPLIVLFMSSHEACTQMSFCPTKIVKIGTSVILEAHNFLCGPPIELLNKVVAFIESFHWELSNGMWHATYMQANQGEFLLLVVGNQIDILIRGFSFGHNLCFKYPNGSWEHITNISVWRDFQWCKELFNPLNFDPWNCSLKIEDLKVHLDYNSQSGEPT